MPRAALAVVTVCCLALTAACGGSGADGGPGGQADDGRPLVVTTVSPITNIVANVGGDAVRVVGLVPEGENSHEFDPAPSVAKTLAQADLMIVNGLRLEEPVIELGRANLRDGVELVALGDRTIDEDEWIFDFSFPKDAGDPNPHLWTNPLYAREFVEIVAEELRALVPDAADEIDARLRAYVERIDALDAATRRATETVPGAQRRLLTYHDSFPYFAREYGWTIIGAVQPSDFGEPTPKDVADLIEQVEREKVPAIFGSEVFPSPVLEQIGKEANVRYVDSLRDDDLPGEPGERRHTYLALMVDDFTTMVTALGGNPEALDAVDVEDVAKDEAAYAR